MAEKAEDRMRPITMLSTSVQNRLACGKSSVNGSTPRIETQITYLRPIRSPIGPPATVPTAKAPRNTKRWICALCTDTPNVSIR